jgi:hypothetical protein
LQFGLFPHKYSESVNLGEYLFRSGTYPGTLYSGGWSYLNSASYLAQGLRLTVPMLGGKLKHEFMLYMERNLQPAHDISPGYMVTYKPVNFFDVGGGVVWSHAISLNSKRLAPKTPANQYSKTRGRPTDGNDLPQTYYFGTYDSAGNANPNGGYDSAGGALVPVPLRPAMGYDSTGAPVTDSTGMAVIYSSPCIAGVKSDCSYYTFKGFKAMARVSLDLGLLTGMQAGQFKVYSEAALLGIENQPYYYEDKMARMPIMFGVNVPTFGVLDRLAVEAEYLASPFPNSNVEVLQSQIPVPTVSPFDYDPDEKKFDEWKWTVHAKRKVVDGVTLYAQAASDHLRHVNYSGIPAGQTATPKASDWYYVLRIEFGI